MLVYQSSVTKSVFIKGGINSINMLISLEIKLPFLVTDRVVDGRRTLLTANRILLSRLETTWHQLNLGESFFFKKIQPHLISALICDSSDRFDCSDILQVLLNILGSAAQVLLLSKHQQWFLFDISMSWVPWNPEPLLFCCNNPAQIAQIITPPPHCWNMGCHSFSGRRMGYDEERVMLLLGCDHDDWDPGALADPICNDSPYPGPWLPLEIPIRGHMWNPEPGKNRP